MPRFPEDQRQQAQTETRTRLLIAAAQAFAREGFHGANVNQIATQAGYGKGTIYNYFASKRNLMLALIETTAAQHLAFIREQVEPVDDPGDRLESFFLAGFEFVNLFSTQARVIIDTVYGVNEDFKQHLWLNYQPLFAFVVEAILAPGIEAKIFRPVEPQRTAVLLMTIYLGTASQINPAGNFWLEPKDVAAFALQGLHG